MQLDAFHQTPPFSLSENKNIALAPVLAGISPKPSSKLAGLIEQCVEFLTSWCQNIFLPALHIIFSHDVMFPCVMEKSVLRKNFSTCTPSMGITGCNIFCDFYRSHMFLLNVQFGLITWRLPILSADKQTTVTADFKRRTVTSCFVLLSIYASSCYLNVHPTKIC